MIRPVLAFSARPIPPIEDPTERAWHAVLDIANVFEEALRQATDPSRVTQIRDRAACCSVILADVEAAATAQLAKGDA